MSAVPLTPTTPASELNADQLVELRKWWDAFGNSNTPLAVFNMTSETLDLRRLCNELATALAFSRVVIKSGEDWSDTCEKMIDGTLKNRLETLDTIQKRYLRQ